MHQAEMPTEPENSKPRRLSILPLLNLQKGGVKIPTSSTCMYKIEFFLFSHLNASNILKDVRKLGKIRVKI